ncbi:MAG: NTP transferase domain-containing protein, partial [Anaerolineales bacterium]
MKTRVVLLAAGKGTRMRSRLPKLLHPLSGQPMLLHAIQAVEGVGESVPLVVVGHDAEALRTAIGSRADFVEQAEQLGTGHALQQARTTCEGTVDLVLVSNADLPLLTTATLKQLVATQKMNKGPLTMLTLKQREARGFGRVKRSSSGAVLAIIEEAEASPEELAIDELNVGAYCFRSDWLWPALEKLKPSPKKKEYY